MGIDGKLAEFLGDHFLCRRAKCRRRAPKCAVLLHENPDQRPALAAAAPAAPRPARTLAERRHAAAVEQMAAELTEAYPDPVDLFEDDLARKLGLDWHRGDSRQRL